MEGLPLAADDAADLVQVGALPLLRGEDGLLRVVLVTTRGSGRWTIPKGNPIAGLAPHKAAAREAREEAGLLGKASKKLLGRYMFWKRREDHWELASVDVYRFKVESRLETFKEQAERAVGVFTPEEAARLVLEPGLTSLIAAVGAGKDGKGKKKRKNAAGQADGGEI